MVLVVRRAPAPHYNIDAIGCHLRSKSLQWRAKNSKKEVNWKTDDNNNTTKQPMKENTIWIKTEQYINKQIHHNILKIYRRHATGKLVTKSSGQLTTGTNMDI